MNFLFILVTSVLAMTQQQKIIARNIMKSQNVPMRSSITDSVLHNNIAFANVQESKVYIDASKLINAPNTFKNVILHECRHLLGAQHFDGTLAMNYSVTVDTYGKVIDDNFLLLPNLGL